MPRVYKRAHALWCIKPHESGVGYVIVRYRDEPAPGIEPRRAQLTPTQRHDTDFGTKVRVQRTFSPLLYAHALQIPAGRKFEVSGQSPGDPRSDQMSGLISEISNPLYPEPGQHPQEFVRIRLKDLGDELTPGTGVEIVVLPFEFEQYLRVEPQQQSKRTVNFPAQAPTNPEDARSDTVIRPRSYPNAA